MLAQVRRSKVQLDLLSLMMQDDNGLHVSLCDLIPTAVVSFVNSQC